LKNGAPGGFRHREFFTKAIYKTVWTEGAGAIAIRSSFNFNEFDVLFKELYTVGMGQVMSEMSLFDAQRVLQYCTC